MYDPGVSGETEGARRLAESLAGALRAGPHGVPDARVEGATVVVEFAGTDEFPPSAFEIRVVQTKGER